MSIMAKPEIFKPEINKISKMFGELPHGYKYQCPCGKNIELQVDRPPKILRKCFGCMVEL